MTKEKNMVTVSGGLAVSGDVADFYRNNAKTGSENLSASMPQLKIVEANSQIEGNDGQFLAPGQFYYSPTKEVFKQVKVSIMTISRGFWALDNQKEPKPKFTQLVGGMMLDTLSPFVMFVSGTRLQNMWNFGKEIKPFTSNKQTPVPMFAFEVVMGLEKVTTDYGTNYVATYKVVRNDKNQIQLIADMEVLNMIRNGVDQVEGMFASFIEQKEVDRNTGELLRNTQARETFNTVADVEPVQEAEPEPQPEDAEASEDISDEIPF